MHSRLHTQYSSSRASRGAARIVDDQHHVDSVDLDEFHQEHAVSDRVQLHHLHVLGRQLAILRLRHLDQRLEDTVV